MEGHLGCPENYSRVFCDSECMGQEGLPSTRARSPVVGNVGEEHSLRSDLRESGLGTTNCPSADHPTGQAAGNSRVSLLQNLNTV
jgi:hypothetical protein